MIQSHEVTIENFTVPYKARKDTEWTDDPANPTNHLTGFIGKGETIWLNPDQSGLGPAWQQARLADKTLCYIHFHDFNLVSAL
ncbi:hypothetical protein [Spirosoma pollinicola]|uniref:Uncharacterized protein n=1 Tax=Spirosoma pollinicola TaxID=2057025 RepID=A0A2K8YS48_9BACT|nr:hypothetical protein [Spirosoma pollinicola]AUD00445.1 hypothetical protein CWM47_00585 [Spirosoma pollinicola]